MRIAFYAPLKAPDHPVPSGDRTMGQGLQAALARGGHDVRIASRFRSFDSGDRIRQRRIRMVGEYRAGRLLSAFRAGAWRPDLWFTYHLYHKAPDWLGPRVAAGLGIPYAVAEASFAPKQENGPWALGHEAVAAALRSAARVFSLNPADSVCILPLLSDPTVLVPLAPFLDSEHLREADRDKARAAILDRHGGSQDQVWLMTAAMMRHDQKLLSYHLLADALGKLEDLPWRLLVAGFGPAETEVRTAFSRFGDRIVWYGKVEPTALHELYAAADIFVWPAIKEAWGMVLLEAQATGTPVVAGRSGGVPAIMKNDETGLLAPEGDAAAFAAAVRSLIVDPHRRRNMGQAAMSLMAQRHDLSVAARVLSGELSAIAYRRRQ